MAPSTAGPTEPNDYFGDDDSSSFSKASTIILPSKRYDLHERSPLLITTLRDGSTSETPIKPRHWLSRKNLTHVLVLLVILTGAGDQVQESPQTRIFESIICYRYFEAVDPSKILLGRERVGPGAIGGVAERLCKDNVVQEQLAMLRGYQQLFDGFPSLLLALPFGWAADRFGRKPFLMLGLISFIVRAVWIQTVTWWWQSFDIRMTWLSTLHACLGGGSAVASGIFFVILSDITPENERAGVFLRAGASSMLGALFMPPLSAWLMQIADSIWTNPWIPAFCGTLLNVLALFSLPLIPETLDYHGPSSQPASRPTTPSTEFAPVLARAMSAPRRSNIESLAARWIAKVKDASSFLTHDRRILALIVPFFGHMLMQSTSQLLLQYMSKRYDITFADATLVSTVYNGVKVLLLFVLLPYLSTLIQHIFRLSGQEKDLYLARASQICLSVGFVLIGLSPNVPTVILSLAVSSMGMGAYLLARSFLTSLVPAHHIARVYSIITLVDTVGAMSGGAILAGLFKRGLALGEFWYGLPFYFLALLLAAFAVLTFAVRLQPGEGEIKLPDDGDAGL